MLTALGSFIKNAGFGRITVFPIFAAVAVFAQSGPAPTVPATPAPTSVTAACPHSAASEIPFTSTIQAKVPGTLDSGHLKVGKEIWVTVMNGLVYPDAH